MKLYYHWWLIFVFLTPTPDGRYPAQKLEEFHEYSDCNTEANRIYKKMQEAYPGDTSYTIVCWNSTEKKA